MVTSPDFEKGIREKIAARVDTSELEQELDGLKKKMRQLEVSKDKIAIQMDNLDVTDSMYEKKYDEMALTENHMDEIQSRLAHIRRKQLSGDRIYNFLIAFDKLYDKLSDAEKKEFMGTFVESIELYPERLENGKFLKHIHFRFPVYYNGTVIDDISWENESTVETVVLLSHKKPDGHINVKVEFGEGEGKVPLGNIAKRAESYKPKERVTYKMVKEYIEVKYGFKVHTAYIAEVKRDLGLPRYDAPNAVEELKQPRQHPTAEKVEAIKDALKHFEVI